MAKITKATILSIELLTLSALGNPAQSQDMYWVGGSGNWTDINHWVKTSGGTDLTGSFPDANSTAYIDANSGLNSNSVITIPSGTYAVKNLMVTNASGFDLLMNGTASNGVQMTIYGNLSMGSNFNMLYGSNSTFHNKWIFDGTNQQNITSGGQDLLNIEFRHANTTYQQLDDLTASEKIRHYGGTWNTTNKEVHSKILQFQDTNSSSSPLTKVFNAGNSKIYCDLWNSRLSYQSLTVNGNYKIHTKQFLGSPGTQFQSFSFNEIHLLNFDDFTTGGSSQIEHNNFDCPYCEVERLIIEDTSRVQLADIFTIQDFLEVVHLGTTILFNGGNGRADEVIFNGLVSTPKVLSCEDVRPIFSNVFNDFTTITRSSGTLNINDSQINNIKTQGGATFQAINSVLQGSSSGWTISNPPVALSYEWIGATGSFQDWNDPSNWQLYGGGYNGCIPTIVDDVFITNAAKGNIRIPSPYQATCRHFAWLNTKNLELKLDGQAVAESELLISGDFELNDNATITAVNNHELIFSSATTNDIITSGRSLPDIYFVGDNGRWELNDDLTCTNIDVESGTIDTQNQDVATGRWRSLENNPKHFIFRSSHITVDGEMLLAQLPNNNVTVDFGTSLIECKLLTSAVPQLYDVKMINTTAVAMDNWPVTLNSLTLAGSARVQTSHNLTVGDLIYNVHNGELALNTAYDFTVNGSIISNTAQSTPARLSSLTSGVQADVHKVDGNMCVLGHIQYRDINAVLPGAMHSPLGTDIINNTGINFDNGASSPNLYWIGGSGNNWKTKSNWSRVSGGCKANIFPDASAGLVFDQYSFSLSNNTIEIPSSESAGHVYFYNSEQLSINVTNTFTPQNISIVSGDVRFAGDFIEVKDTTHLSGAGLLITDLNDYITESLDANNSLWIIRNGSQATIKKP